MRYGLRIYPLSPSFCICSTSSSLEDPEEKITRTSELISRMAAKQSRPFISGMTISRITRTKERGLCLNSSIPCFPFSESFSLLLLTYPTSQKLLCVQPHENHELERKNLYFTHHHTSIVHHSQRAYNAKTRDHAPHNSLTLLRSTCPSLYGR